LEQLGGYVGPYRHLINVLKPWIKLSSYLLLGTCNYKFISKDIACKMFIFAIKFYIIGYVYNTYNLFDFTIDRYHYKTTFFLLEWTTFKL